MTALPRTSRDAPTAARASLLYTLAPAAAPILLTADGLLAHHKPGRASRTPRSRRNR